MAMRSCKRGYTRGKVVDVEVSTRRFNDIDLYDIFQLLKPLLEPA